jgi:NAD+ kinase
VGPVLVIGSRAKPGVVEAVDKWMAHLEKEFGVVAVDLDGKRDLTKTKAKWAIVFGGDGAILAASRRMGAKPLPTLAVNHGRLGFLTEVEDHQLEDALARIAEGKYKLLNRMRLRMTLGKTAALALNDVVFTTASSGRLIHVVAKIEKREALRYAGDGVVLATPAGSTAYSLAAGGPILDPELEAMVITPLAAHALSQRPLVVPSSRNIELFLGEGESRGAVIVDGQDRWDVGPDDVVHVRKAQRPFQLIRVGMRSYYSRLRRILGWGGRPRYS